MTQVVQSIAVIGGTGQLGAAIARRLAKAGKSIIIGSRDPARTRARIRQSIKDNTTPRHVPAKITQVCDIPRTISGKIVELAVRNIVHGKPVTNTDALANPEALAHFRDRPELAG